MTAEDLALLRRDPAVPPQLRSYLLRNPNPRAHAGPRE